MRNIYYKRQLKGLNMYPLNVISHIGEIISIIDENYGEYREVEAGLGGYVVIAENIVDIETLKKDKIQGIVSEYTDIIECSEGVNWTSSLFLLSSDYSIVVMTTEELSKYLLE